MVRDLSGWRSNLERCPCPRRDPGVQPAAVQESSTGPGLAAIYREGWVTYGHICIPARRLGHHSRQILATMLPPIPKLQSKVEATITSSISDYYLKQMGERTPRRMLRIPKIHNTSNLQLYFILQVVIEGMNMLLSSDKVLQSPISQNLSRKTKNENSCLLERCLVFPFWSWILHLYACLDFC